MTDEPLVPSAVRRRRAAAFSTTTGLVTATTLGMLLLLVVIGVLVSAGGPDDYLVIGYSYPGAVTAIGAALLRFLFDIAAAVCAGALCYAVFFTAGFRPGTPAPGLSAEAWAAVRLGGAAAWAWFAATILLIPFDAADSIGVPVTRMLSPTQLAGAFAVLYEPAWWAISGLLALIVAIGCRVVLRWRPTLALAVLATIGLLPPVIAGHTASGTGHDIAMSGMLLHVIAAGLWLGVLATMLVALRRGGPRPRSRCAATRGSRPAAGWCSRCRA